MEEKSIRDISKRCRDLYQRGEKALTQKNYPFAIEMLREAVRVEPTFSEGRDKLRKAQLMATNNGNVTGFKKLIADLTSGLGKGQKFLNAGNFAEALNVAEEALSKNPSNIKALQFLVKCGETMQFAPIQVAAYKMLFKFDGKNVNTLRTMAQFYKSVNMIDEMIEAYQTICNLRPTDSDAISEMKSATAYAAMNRGNWENASSYRDIIKDKDKAKELDLMEMTQVRDSETLHAILATLTKKIEENGENITDRKRMAELYSQGEMWTQSLQCYEKMVELSGTTEPTIANIMTEIKANIFDQEIAEASDESTKNQLISQKDQMLFDHASNMVKRFPNDPAYRFDLGMALYNRQA
ncbi:MAG: tetratricopeptide repeat protein, partial [Lentisphaeria bacterium]